MSEFLETMRAEFKRLSDLADEIRAKAAPFRAAYDEYSAETDARLKEMRAALREIEAPLFEIDNQRAAISRALRGKTGATTEE